MSELKCVLCEGTYDALSVETADVRCNVRAFSSEHFPVWRCPACRSIHSAAEVDLGHYYSRYPFHDLPEDIKLRTVYDNFISRLRKAGLQKKHRVLDYGCGSGAFLRHLHRRGYNNAVGFDEYSANYADRSALGQPADIIVSQDIIEHVESPRAWLEQMDALLAPGGAIVIGTPNAAALDLKKPEDFLHALHQPYHLHILSKDALIQVGEERGWICETYYPTHYANTTSPFLNGRFYYFYMSITDRCLDTLMEPPRVGPLLSRLPSTLYYGFFGYYSAPEIDVMAVFRKPS